MNGTAMYACLMETSLSIDVHLRTCERTLLETLICKRSAIRISPPILCGSLSHACAANDTIVGSMGFVYSFRHIHIHWHALAPDFFARAIGEALQTLVEASSRDGMYERVVSKDRRGVPFENASQVLVVRPAVSDLNETEMRGVGTWYIPPSQSKRDHGG